MRSIQLTLATRLMFLEIQPIRTQVLIKILDLITTFNLIFFKLKIADDATNENDEVADDPFFSRDVPALPKKAPWKALMEEDPRVIARTIEDERINDIYFTTIVGVTSGLTVFVIGILF